MNYLKKVSTLPTGTSDYKAAPRSKSHQSTMTKPAKTTGSSDPKAKISQAIQLTPTTTKSERKQIQRKLAQQMQPTMGMESSTNREIISHECNDVESALKKDPKTHKPPEKDDDIEHELSKSETTNTSSSTITHKIPFHPSQMSLWQKKEQRVSQHPLQIHPPVAPSANKMCANRMSHRFS